MTESQFIQAGEQAALRWNMHPTYQASVTEKIKALKQAMIDRGWNVDLSSHELSVEHIGLDHPLLKSDRNQRSEEVLLWMCKAIAIQEGALKALPDHPSHPQAKLWNQRLSGAAHHALHQWVYGFTMPTSWVQDVWSKFTQTLGHEPESIDMDHFKQACVNMVGLPDRQVYNRIRALHLDKPDRQEVRQDDLKEDVSEDEILERLKNPLDAASTSEDQIIKKDQAHVSIKPKSR